MPVPVDVILTALQRHGVTPSRASDEPDVVVIEGLGFMDATIIGDEFVVTVNSTTRGVGDPRHQIIERAHSADRSAVETAVLDAYNFLR